MKFYAEGIQKSNITFDSEILHRALKNREILEGRAMSFDKEKQLHISLGNYDGIIPYEECANGVREGNVRDIALITRVGREVCFTVEDINESSIPKRVILSRANAQKMCKAEYIDTLVVGDVIPCTITHIEKFGAFCDIGCGISALLPIDCLSISRIRSPADRLKIGDEIKCVIKSCDEQGRLVLSLKELLGTWRENAQQFCVGETVIGVVRGIENYGVFIEISPNLAGLAEYDSTLCIGQTVSVYIKSIQAEKMKIKLVILHKCSDEGFVFPIEYFCDKEHIENWNYTD